MIRPSSRLSDAGQAALGGMAIVGLLLLAGWALVSIAAPQQWRAFGATLISAAYMWPPAVIGALFNCDSAVGTCDSKVLLPAIAFAPLPYMVLLYPLLRRSRQRHERSKPGRMARDRVLGYDASLALLVCTAAVYIVVAAGLLVTVVGFGESFSAVTKPISMLATAALRWPVWLVDSLACTPTTWCNSTTVLSLALVIAPLPYAVAGFALTRLWRWRRANTTHR